MTLPPRLTFEEPTVYRTASLFAILVTGGDFGGYAIRAKLSPDCDEATKRKEKSNWDNNRPIDWDEKKSNKQLNIIQILKKADLKHEKKVINTPTARKRRNDGCPSTLERDYIQRNGENSKDRATDATVSFWGDNALVEKELD